MKADDFDRVIATNLRSVFLCTKKAMRGMLRARWGRVISIASVAGVVGNPGQANYAASKAGIIGFTKSISKEVGSRGITANVVAPGFIATDMTDGLGDDVKASAAAAISLGRFGRPEEVAGGGRVPRLGVRLVHHGPGDLRRRRPVHVSSRQPITRRRERMERSEVSERLTGVLVSELGLDASKIRDDAHFEEDLDVDSLGVVELLMALEDEFDVKIPDEEAESIVTVGQAVDLVYQKLS